MKYNELKEMNIKDWDGEPFRAIYAGAGTYEINDYDMRLLDGIGEGDLIVGYVDGKWQAKDGLSWSHVYPIEWNKKPKKRMSNRQLAMWLAKGNAQWRYMDTDMINAHTEFYYGVGYDNAVVRDNIRVRKWDSEEWIEPTTDLLEDN